MLKFTRKNKREEGKQRWKEREKRRNREGEKGKGIDRIWQNIGKKKKMCRQEESAELTSRMGNFVGPVVLCEWKLITDGR